MADRDQNDSKLNNAKESGKHATLERLLYSVLGWQKAQRSFCITSPKIGFNAFTAVSGRYDENRHSRVLATLLDPTGQHGQGLLFLHYWLEELNKLPIPRVTIQNPQEWRVSREVTLDDGSRIDLLIEGPGVVIGVENKVHADEAPGQLAGYAQQIAKRSAKQAQRAGQRSSCYLVFLTPNGHGPKRYQDLARIQEFVYFATFSYYQEALDVPSLCNWLDTVIPTVHEVPSVYYFSRQYRELVAEIGGESVNSEHGRRIAETFLTDFESFSAARAISDGLFEKKVQLHKWFWEELRNALARYDVRGYLFHTDAASIRRYLNGYKGVWPGLRCNTGLEWTGVKLFIVLEMIDSTQRNNLTWKLMPEGSNPKTGYLSMRNETPNYRGLDERLQHFKGDGWIVTDWSFLTSDFELPGGEPLDLTHFTGRAEQLAGDRAEVIINDIADRVGTLRKDLQRLLNDKPG